MNSLVVNVHGLPAPQGSKRHVGRGIMVESSKRVKPWREAVKHAALDVLSLNNADDYPFGTEPVGITATFYLPRPKGHFRTGRNAHLLRDAAPDYPATKPDIDKILRSSLDALGEACVWRDDSQVVHVVARKEYGTPGAHFEIAAMPRPQVSTQ